MESSRKGPGWHTKSAIIFWFIAAFLLLSSAIAKFIRTGDVTWELTVAGLIFLSIGISSITAASSDPAP